MNQKFKPIKTRIAESYIIKCDDYRPLIAELNKRKRIITSIKPTFVANMMGDTICVIAQKRS